jgi:hypothetical protein
VTAVQRPILAATLYAIAAFAVARSAAAQTIVPVEQAPYHVPVFSNRYVIVLDVVIPPGRTSGFHRHELDTVGVQITDTPRTGQLPGAAATVTALRQPGTVQFARYSREPNEHSLSITGDGVFHNVVVELLQPTPYGLAPGSRDGVAGYTVVLDNERVRVWRLVLAPGERAPPITQTAPGIRIVVRGGELVESIADRPDRGMAPNAGAFYWQDGGVTRALRNVGTTPLELVEIELK